MQTSSPAHGVSVNADRETIERSAWISWFLFTCFCIFQFTLQGSIGVFSDSLQESLTLNAESLSLLSSSFYYSYVLMQIPVGILLDRFGVRNSGSLALLSVAAALTLFALAGNVYIAILARILMGAGCAFGFLGVIFACSKWFPLRYFALMVAATECLGMVGVTGFNNVLSEIVFHYDWRVASWVCAGLALLIAICVFAFVPKEEKISAAKHSKLSFFESMKAVLTYKEVWFGGLFAFALFSTVTVFAGLWGIPFLMSSANLTIVGATSLVSMTYLGSALASPLVGWLGGRFKPSSIMIPGTIMSTLLLLAVIYGPKSSLALLYIVIFLVGFMSSVYQLPFAIVNHAVPSSIKGVAMGITNMLCMVSGPILAPMIGYFLDSSIRSNGQEFEAYPLASFQSALLVLPITVGLATFLALNLREKR